MRDRQPQPQTTVVAHITAANRVLHHTSWMPTIQGRPLPRRLLFRRDGYLGVRR